MNDPAVIFDIDGTIADCSHRRHFLDGPKKNWNAFYEALDEDKPKFNVIRQIDLFRRWYGEDLHIVFVTGRPEKYRARTVRWLVRELDADTPIPCGTTLFMRPDGDNTPDDILKKEIYLEKIAPFYNVELVFDDRDKVVKMWRSLGLECWQVAEGNF